MAMYPHSGLDIFEDPFFHQGFEPRFGLGLLPSDFHTDIIVPRAANHHLPTGYRRPWAIARQAVMNDQKHKHFGKDGFQACVDVHHFQPSEISVKTIDNNVIVEAMHEEREDGHGSVQRHFVRKYALPKEYDVNTIISSLSSDGVLTIKAPPPASLTSGERHVQITHSNVPAHMSIKDNKPMKDKKAHEEPKNGK